MTRQGSNMTRPGTALARQQLVLWRSNSKHQYLDSSAPALSGHSDGEFPPSRQSQELCSHGGTIRQQESSEMVTLPRATLATPLLQATPVSQQEQLRRGETSKQQQGMANARRGDESLLFTPVHGGSMAVWWQYVESKA